jgi:iron complex outermembrane receptor protein
MKAKKTLASGANFMVAVGVLSLSNPLISAAQGVSAASDDDQLTEVVVSAEKRVENVQEVPISIGVLSAEQLDQQQVTNMEDLSRAVPDLAITSPGNGVPGQGSYSIRGVSSISTASGSGLGQTTIGVYLDDVPMTSATGAGGDTSLQVFDLSRIEVLRGPQGTFYGASAMGGTVRYVSNQPDLANNGWSAMASLSSTQNANINYVEQAVGNVALIDNELALRVGAQVSHNSGFVNNYDPYTGESNSDNNFSGSAVIRASLKYQSADGSLTILPSLFMQRFDDQGNNEAIQNTHFASQNYVQQTESDRIFVPSITVDKDFGWANLTSSSSYFWRQLNFVLDATPFLEAPIFGFSYPTPFPLGNLTTQGSEELRLTSKTQEESGLPFDWVVGVFWSDSNVTDTQYLYPQNFSDFENLLVGTYGAATAASFGEFQYGSNLYTEDEWLNTSQWSGFGEINYSPVKALTATAGLRYLMAHQDASAYESGFYNGPIPSTYNVGFRADHTSPKFALKYDYSSQGQVYVTAVEGFRLGGGNIPIPNSAFNAVGAACLQDLQAIGRTSGPLSYNPDSLWSYEIGDKSTLFNNRVSVDAALFDIIWKNVQQPITLNDPNPNCGYAFGANAGKARSQGADVSINAQLMKHLDAFFSGNITHATITEAAPDTGETNGTWLNGVPRWQANAGFVWSPPLAGRSSFFGVDGHWIGQAHQGYNPDLAGFIIPQYFLLNANLGVRFGKVKLSLFGKNLLNNDTNILTGQQAPYYGLYLQPRTFGLAVQKEY